jgi:hypothetical protein
VSFAPSDLVRKKETLEVRARPSVIDNVAVPEDAANYDGEG